MPIPCSAWTRRSPGARWASASIAAPSRSDAARRRRSRGPKTSSSVTTARPLGGQHEAGRERRDAHLDGAPGAQRAKGSGWRARRGREAALGEQPREPVGARERGRREHARAARRRSQSRDAARRAARGPRRRPRARRSSRASSSCALARTAKRSASRRGRGAARDAEAVEQHAAAAATAPPRSSSTRRKQLVGGRHRPPGGARGLVVLERLARVAEQPLAPRLPLLDEDQSVVSGRKSNRDSRAGWSSGSSASEPGGARAAQQRCRSSGRSRGPGTPWRLGERAERRAALDDEVAVEEQLARRRRHHARRAAPRSAGSRGRTRGATRPRRRAARSAPAARAAAGRSRRCRRAPRTRRAPRRAAGACSPRARAPRPARRARGAAPRLDAQRARAHRRARRHAQRERRPGRDDDRRRPSAPSSR